MSRPPVPLIESPKASTPPPKQPTPPPSEQPQNPPPEQPTTPPSKTPFAPPSEHLIFPTSQPLVDITQTPPESSSPNSEPKPTFPTLEEAISLFAESSVENIRSLSKNCGISDDPSTIRIHWNRVIRWMTSEAFKLKSLSEQVRNNFIKEVGERLQAQLVREAAKKDKREGEEKAHLEEEQQVREAAEKVVAEAEAKAKVDAEETARIVAEEAAKASTNVVVQGEQSNSGFAPLVLNTLEELQKEQQIMQARLDHQDSVNNNI
ncbi:uncharacterized protein LOC127079011 [Lathyrus oleraceus]|uniref:uncharacterized protein LOC127079011 n=1 Tax=Pisum sativum TaxID=3888 RepID=UPI0021D0B41D|nr:uncharacterized protein LOC127079011 [Pisum sativum]